MDEVEALKERVRKAEELASLLGAERCECCDTLGLKEEMARCDAFLPGGLFCGPCLRMLQRYEADRRELETWVASQK